jgi:ADP-dependent NAD(P)H-hydrate dehydratase / NAD(P)H-hydrate epimerase
MHSIKKNIFKNLNLPKPNSRKRDNGTLLIISGSLKYFGAMLFCVKAASRLVDLIFVLTTKENRKLIEKLKYKTAEFMPVESPINGHATGSAPIHRPLDDANCILIGPGLDISPRTKKLTLDVLKSGKKAVLDADALNVLDKNLMKYLSPVHILTPHHREFKKLFTLDANAQNASKMAKKYNCTIVLKGPVDIIAESDGKISLNKTGNAGLTKGGTGDVLAGLIAGFYCTNDSFTSAAAGTFLIGAAGDALHKKVGTFYNAEDIINQIPLTLKKLVNSNK